MIVTAGTATQVARKVIDNKELLRNEEAVKVWLDIL